MLLPPGRTSFGHPIAAFRVTAVALCAPRRPSDPLGPAALDQQVASQVHSRADFASTTRPSLHPASR